MATGRNVYDVITYDLAEDLQLRLGIVTDQQFLDHLNETIVDFCTQTGLWKRIYTQMVLAGQSQYAVPDDVMRVDIAFLAGRYIAQETVETLNRSLRNWRRTQAVPRAWHADALPIGTVELAPSPNYNGSYILGPNEPDPPQSVYDSFAATVLTTTGNVIQTASQHRGLTIVGPRKPSAGLASIDDPIPVIPDEFALAYLPLGVLERIFSGDNENQDQQRSLWCGAQYREGIAVGRAISGEIEDTE